jgi:hypothetical protein
METSTEVTCRQRLQNAINAAFGDAFRFSLPVPQAYEHDELGAFVTLFRKGGYSVGVHGTDQYEIKVDMPLSQIQAMPREIADGMGQALTKAAYIVQWGEMYNRRAV